MDKLAEEQRTELKKMSTARLAAKLVKAGVAEESLEGLDRPELLEM